MLTISHRFLSRSGIIAALLGILFSLFGYLESPASGYYSYNWFYNVTTK